MQKVFLFSLTASGHALPPAFDSFTLPTFDALDSASVFSQRGLMESHLFDVHPRWGDQHQNQKYSLLIETGHKMPIHKASSLFQQAEKHGQSLTDRIHAKYGTQAARNFGRDFSDHFLSTLENQLDNNEHANHGMHNLISSVEHAFHTASARAHISLKKQLSEKQFDNADEDEVEAEAAEDDAEDEDDEEVEDQVSLRKSFGEEDDDENDDEDEDDQIEPISLQKVEERIENSEWFNIAANAIEFMQQFV